MRDSLKWGMIRITQQDSAKSAKSYYTKADYYSEGQELVGSYSKVRHDVRLEIRVANHALGTAYGERGFVSAKRDLRFRRRRRAPRDVSIP